MAAGARIVQNSLAFHKLENSTPASTNYHLCYHLIHLFIQQLRTWKTESSPLPRMLSQQVNEETKSSLHSLTWHIALSVRYPSSERFLSMFAIGLRGTVLNY